MRWAWGLDSQEGSFAGAPGWTPVAVAVSETASSMGLVLQLRDCE